MPCIDDKSLVYMYVYSNGILMKMGFWNKIALPFINYVTYVYILYVPTDLSCQLPLTIALHEIRIASSCYSKDLITIISFKMIPLLQVSTFNISLPFNMKSVYDAFLGLTNTISHLCGILTSTSMLRCHLKLRNLIICLIGNQM